MERMIDYIKRVHVSQTAFVDAEREAQKAHGYTPLLTCPQCTRRHSTYFVDDTGEMWVSKGKILSFEVDDE